MKFQKQMFYHRPHEGIYGDCQRTVYACLLDMHRDDVPHWGLLAQGDDAWWLKQQKKWLREKGYIEVNIPFSGDQPLSNVLGCVAVNSSYDLYYTIAGTSRTGCNHVVIAQGEEIVWDTALNNSGIVGPCDDGFYWVSHLVPIHFTEKRR